MKISQESEKNSKPELEIINLDPETEKVLPVEKPSQKNQKVADSKLAQLWWLFLLIGLTAIGGVAYLWSSNQKISYSPENQVPLLRIEPTPFPPVQIEEDSLEALTVQSNSDEIEAIEKDLDLTDLEGLDRELAEIEQALSLP
ncbi:MAG: hypothetical protein JW991_03350 [Candidatus Pacebacteria bacterium]|nr:hypothetical protein [Candidatus Paceibacterota bacterium]